ncbi:extracellular solute-binding protein [Paenibacillus sp. MER TA 81-3]|uniref:extracellular solute-binding protein n=1 Tax=Paenibacillus sp. MER TA 81-3 TaxID=2939573 RepID=UPI0020418F58|nr:extracellular solute-binding protein [Paenibacillus sp. MER TA 81-3]MCM3337065.1 extracellular solute-binding protein [Paenibacillus sp. MER TA 81-3]
MPNLKKTLVAVLMIVISLLLLSQFSGSVPTFTESEPSLNEVAKHPPQSKKNETWKQLKVAVHLSPMSFIQMRKLNQTFIDETGIFVELVNANDEQASEQWPRELQMQDSADIILTDSNSVEWYAQKGWLLPMDPPSNGSEASPAWLNDRIKWNGYTWAEPAQLDPYVLVWNKDKLKFGTPLPSKWEDWKQLFASKETSLPSVGQQGSGALGGGEPKKEDQTAVPSDETPPTDQLPATWFAWHEQDDYALLSMLWRLGLLMPESNPSPDGQKDWVTTRTVNGAGATAVTWSQHVSELEPYLTHFKAWKKEASGSETWDLLKSGEIGFAIVPYSEAVLEVSDPLVIEPPGEVKLPAGLWVASRSYVIAAHSPNEAEARRWIDYMTRLSVQHDWYDTLSVLPVHEQAYMEPWKDILQWLPQPFLPYDVNEINLIQKAGPLESWMASVRRWMDADLTKAQLNQAWPKK